MGYSICKTVSVSKNDVKITSADSNLWAVDRTTGREYREYKTRVNTYFTDILHKYGKDVCEGYILVSFYLGSIQGGSSVYAKYLQYLCEKKEEPKEITDAYSLYNEDRSEENTTNLAKALFNDFNRLRSEKVHSVIMLSNGTIVVKITSKKIKFSTYTTHAKVYTNAIELYRDLEIINNRDNGVTAKRVNIKSV